MGDRRIDEASLVCAAALVLEVTPADVLEEVEIAGLTALVATVDAIEDAARAAAHLLERIVLDRPFPRSSAAIGWLAAVDLLRAEGQHVDARPQDVVALCAAIRAGTADVVGQLRRWSTPSGFACPACGRTVYAFATARTPVLHGTSRTELTARCAFEHRRHDRRGRTRDADEPVERDRTVLARGECGSVALAVGGRTVIVSPYCDDPLIRRVSEVDDVSPGELLGRWDALVARATTIAFVPGAVDDIDGLL